MDPGGSRRGSGDGPPGWPPGSCVPGSWAFGSWALAGWAPGCAARWYSATTGAV